MKNKKLLAIILLSLSFCFVSGVGYGEVEGWMFYEQGSLMEHHLLNAKVNYIMSNPDSFQQVEFSYDPFGGWGDIAGLPENVNTEGKIVIVFIDRRGLFPEKNSDENIFLLVHLQVALETIYSFLDVIATDMDNDIVATFHRKGGAFVGYFSEGEYHLWED